MQQCHQCDDLGTGIVLTSLQRNEIFGCVHTDSIVSWTLNYVEKLTKDDTAPPESYLLPPPYFMSNILLLY